MKTTTKTGIVIGGAVDGPPRDDDIIDGEDPMREFEELCEWAEWLFPRVAVGLFVGGLLLGLIKGLMS